MREEVCVFRGLEEEWLRQREQQVQRPCRGSEPLLPEEQRAVSVAGVYDGREMGRVAGRSEQALQSVSWLFACVKECLQTRNRGLGWWRSSTCWKLQEGRRGLIAPHPFSPPRNSFGQDGLGIPVELMNNLRV